MLCYPLILWEGHIMYSWYSITQRERFYLIESDAASVLNSKELKNIELTSLLSFMFLCWTFLYISIPIDVGTFSTFL